MSLIANACPRIVNKKREYISVQNDMARMIKEDILTIIKDARLWFGCDIAFCAYMIYDKSRQRKGGMRPWNLSLIHI